jgi:hypothetical protein
VVSTTYLTGTHVRFTTDNLGMVGRSETVSAGDEGVVIGPNNDGWILVEPCKFPQSICPVDPSMIEPLA